jgi:hypothetical protein
MSNSNSPSQRRHPFELRERAAGVENSIQGVAAGLLRPHDPCAIA